MFAVGRQIKKNKIKNALQIIFFFLNFYKSFCSVIVYEKKRHKLGKLKKKKEKKEVIV
jgi:hypothetical protein